MSPVGRGRVETSNLRDHAVLARSEASEIAAAARYARLRELMDLIEVGSKVALQMCLAVVLRVLSRGERGHYALIACISGTIPMICMTRLRL